VVIENSTFEDNDLAINIAKHNLASISSNTFRGNRVGVRLYDELQGQVSFNTIADNHFADNEFGVYFSVEDCGAQPPSYPQYCQNGNRVVGNDFVGNRLSGVFFDGTQCSSTGCENVDASVEDNVFSGNGFGPLPDPPPYGPTDDGITVLGPTNVVDGVAVTRNLAVSNSDLGIEAPGAIDGGDNRASRNGNPLQCVGVVCMPAVPAIEVAPRQYDFGLVDLGTSSAQLVTISNTGDAPLVVDGVALLTGSGVGFKLTDAPPVPFEIEPNATVDIGLLFAGFAGGAASATLRVTSNDPEEPVIEVPLTGYGVSYDAQAMALLSFFDGLVTSGELVGQGPGNSASRRLNALRNMIEASGDLLERGRTRMACLQLEVARRRTDGLFPPPDFASGAAAPELEAEIAQLRSNLRCRVRKGTAKCGLGAELALLLPAMSLAASRSRRRRAN
jgi:hypothetical protein